MELLEDGFEASTRRSDDIIDHVMSLAGKSEGTLEMDPFMRGNSAIHPADSAASRLVEVS